MILNYFLIAFRHLTSKKVYSAINILGLAIGLAACLIMIYYVQHELSYESFHSKHDRITRITYESKNETGTRGIAKVPFPMKPILLQEYPEVEAVVRFYNSAWSGTQTLIRNGADVFSEEGFMFTDPEVFSVFDFELIKGDPATALANPESVVISETIAKKYYGDDDPIGKTLNYQNQVDLHVTGVFRDVPANSHIDFEFLAPIELQRVLWKIPANNHYDFEEDWKWSGSWLYVLLNKEDHASFEAKIQKIVIEHLVENGETRGELHLQPLKDIHLHSDLIAEFKPNGSIAQIVGFSAIAGLILLIAIFNFVNLSTARSAERAKEVGIRKVMGAFRFQLILQFVGEALIITLLAFLIAGLLVEISLPFFKQLLNVPLEVKYLSPGFLTFLVSGIIIIGFIAGLYPAFFLSRFQPAKTLKGLIEKPTSGNLLLRKILVTLQFSISTFLVTGIIIVHAQLNFINSKKLGFDKEQVLILTNGNRLLSGADSFQNELKTISDITEVYRGYIPGKAGWSNTFYIDNSPEAYTMRLLYVGENFTKMFGLDVVAGRDFRSGARDTIRYALINETAARAFHLTNGDAIGRTIHFVGGSDNKTEYDLEVIGIINDANFESLHEVVRPQIFINDTWGSIAIKANPKSWPDLISSIEARWKQNFPQWPFEHTFLSEDFSALYMKEQRMASAMIFFTVLAICIASMGLMGIVSLATQQRSREIGVRKVLGASVGSIWLLITRNYFSLLLISFIISIPFIFYSAEQWLQSFAFRITLDPLLFLFGGVVVLTIALLTMSWQSVRASRQKPTDLIKHE